MYSLIVAIAQLRFLSSNKLLLKVKIFTSYPISLTLTGQLSQIRDKLTRQLSRIRDKQKIFEEEKSNFQSLHSNLGHTDARPTLYRLGYHSQWLSVVPKCSYDDFTIPT